jgi:hypothetical protein
MRSQVTRVAHIGETGDMRPEVRHLIELGTMPDEMEGPPVERVQQYQDALEALPRPLKPDEAVALLDTFPPGENGSLFELEWPLVHAIETAVGPELLAALDDRSWWVQQLRVRAENAGLL